jgi:hypothetical protein
MVIFHCYVTLPEGTYDTYDDIFFVVCAKTQPRYAKYQEATGKAGDPGLRDPLSEPGSDGWYINHVLFC